MKKYENIKCFVREVENHTSKIHPIYVKNFREIIKVIPIIGSWLDSMSIGLIEDNILEERLTNLEIACENALKLDDTQQLISEIANINGLFFVLMITNQSKIFSQNEEIRRNIDELVLQTKNGKEIYSPDKNFLFVTISGTSASGKDHILDLIYSRKSRSQVPIEILTKFTTRKKRLIDSKYYDFITEEKFDLLEKSGNIIFPYIKRGYYYGFDNTHLLNASREEIVMFAIFTHFESLPADKDFLKKIGINHVAILLDVDRDSLLIRSDGRNLDLDDTIQRINSIESDLTFINENKSFINKSFDLIVQNGDGHAKHETLNNIVKYVGLEDLII